jgi:hypothetical protein
MSEVITRRYGITKNGVYCTVELRIDVDSIALDLVNKAARNKSGVATEVSRCIVAKVIDRAAQAASHDTQGEKNG